MTTLDVNALQPTDDNIWYVVHCRPLKEAQAATNLRERLGVSVYQPQVIKRVRGRTQLTPIFPRYLFVQADLRHVQLSSINSTPGVIRLLDFGAGPVPLTDRMINSIREIVESLNMRGGLPTHQFSPGETVLLKGRPWHGLEAVFVGSMTSRARVVVLLEFLGRMNKVEIDIDIVEKAPVDRVGPPSLPTRVRGTRGGLRKIASSLR
jgi:transcriptional antiterminator RfaH